MPRYGVDGAPIAPQNTTINAVIVVEHYPHGQKRFGRHVVDLAKRRGYSSEKLPLKEWVEEMEAARGTERDILLEAIRVVVHENPYARVPLPSGVFQGPFDERYGMTEEGFISRLFAGSEIIGLDDPPAL